MIDIKQIIETRQRVCENHPELPKAGLTSHPTKKTRYCHVWIHSFSLHARRCIVVLTVVKSSL